MNSLVRVVAMIAVFFSSSRCLGETERAVYKNHYEGGGGKGPKFAEGEIAVDHPSVGQSIDSATAVSVRMRGFPLGSVDDWTMASTSSWDLAASTDGGPWRVIVQPTAPNQWSPNPNGSFIVNLPFALPTTPGAHTMDLELYGQCTQCREAIIPDTGATNWKIAFRMSWETRSDGVVSVFQQVQFLTPDQSRGIDGATPYFPARRPGTFTTMSTKAQRCIPYIVYQPYCCCKQRRIRLWWHRHCR